MLWVEVNEQGQKDFFAALRVTFASSHAISLETYQALRRHIVVKEAENTNEHTDHVGHIGLKSEDVYFVTDPHHTITYRYANRPFVCRSKFRHSIVSFMRPSTCAFKAAMI